MRGKGLLIGAGVLVAIVAVALFAGRDTWATAKIGTVYVAKQTCSCLFVAGRPMESCRTDYDPEAIKPLTVEATRQRRQGVCARGPGLRAGEVRAGLRLPSGELRRVPMSAIWRSAIWTAVAVAMLRRVCARGARAAAAAAGRRAVADERVADGPASRRVDRAALDAAMADAFDKKAPGLGETREVAIIVGGKLVHEQYAARLQRRHAAGVVVDGEVDHAGAGRRRRQAGQGRTSTRRWAIRTGLRTTSARRSRGAPGCR